MFTENHCTIPGFTLRVTAGHKALKEHGLKSRDLFAGTMISGNTFPKEGMMGSSHGTGSQNPRLLGPCFQVWDSQDWTHTPGRSNLSEFRAQAL